MHTEYNISTEELAAIEQYLLNELNTDERLAFEQKMSADTVWASKVKETTLLFTGIETAAMRERLHSYHSAIKKNHTSVKDTRIVTFNRKWMAAAAVLLIVAVAGWWFIMKPGKYEQLYNAYYKPDPGLISAMGVGDNYLFNKAMLDYKTGNYKKAIAVWNQLKDSVRPNDTLNYFLGAAEQANGNNTAAIPLLQSMAADTSHAFFKDACWYTGLAFIKQGDTKKAVYYLEKSGRPESRELISQLK